MKYFIVAVCFIAIFGQILSQRECKELNAYASISYENHHRQHLKDFTIVDQKDEYNVLYIQKYETKPKNPEKPFEMDSFTELFYGDFKYSVLYGTTKRIAIINDKTEGFKSHILHGTSNTAYVKNADAKEPRVWVSFLTPIENSKLFTAQAFLLDPSKEEKTKSEFPQAQFTYSDDKEEPIYKPDGTIIDNLKPSSRIQEDSTFIMRITSGGSGGGNSSLSQPSEQPSEQSPQQFVVLVQADESLKMYKCNYDGNAVTVESKTLLIPKVEGLIDAPLGGLMELSRDGKTAYVVAPVNEKQVQPLARYHNRQVKLLPHQIQTPFLFKISIEDLSIQEIVNVGLENVVHLYASGLDVNRAGDGVIIVGNTNKKGHPEDDQKAYYALYKNGEMKSQGWITGLGEDEHKRTYAVINAVAFSPDNGDGGENDEKIIVGGHKGYPQKMKYSGLLAYITLNGNETSSLDSIQVGETRSNSVKFIKKLLRDDKIDIVTIGNMEKGPETPDDIQQYVNTGFWQIDCSPPSKSLEKALTIIFYVIFAITCAIVIFTVGFYSFMCIVQRRTRAGAEGETDSLLGH
jgi:hypothetical protein